MTNIRDLALAADKAATRKSRDEKASQRGKKLNDLLEAWDEKTSLSRYGGDSVTQPMPDRDEFTWVEYPGFTHGYPGGRNPHVYGWSWTNDEIRFIYDASSSGVGCCVVLTCPDCGEEHAEHWYGLDNLGKLIRTQRALGHKCREIALRTLAYAIREAAETTHMTPHAVAELAAERKEAWPR